MDWELSEVGQPFVEQLKGLGWTHIEGDLDDPAITGRASVAPLLATE